MVTPAGRTRFHGLRLACIERAVVLSGLVLEAR
jgi:hypothetical protein